MKKKGNKSRYSWKKTIRTRAYRLVLYLLLITGGLIFSFPFFWLLSTSFKADREIMVTPPRWMPEIPHNVKVSPYLQSGHSIAQPAGITEEVWDTTLATLERLVWENIVRYKSSDRSRQLLGFADSSWEAQMALVAGAQWSLWKKEITTAVLERVMPHPDASETEPMLHEQIIGVVMNRITPQAIDRALADIYRSLCIGRFTIRDINRLDFDVYSLNPEGWAGWKFHTGNVGPASRLIVENNPALEIPYSFERGSEAVMSYSVNLSKPMHEIDKITLAIHGDASFHKVNLIVETAEAVYKSDEDFLVDTDSWKNAVWGFRPRQPGEVLPSIRLVRVPEQTPSVTDTNTVKLTVIITKSSHLWAIMQKFIRNYTEMTKYVPFLTYLRNTIILVVLNILAQLFACTLVAYGFARVRWPGRNVVFVILLATMMLPGQVTMIPQFLIWKYLGMYDTWQPLWLHSLFGSAFFIFLLRQFFMTIPRDLEDAARIDGCGYFGVYWRIMLPQIKPALAAIAVFQFMGSWNDFMGPLIYISSDNLSPLALGLYTMQSVHASDWGMLMAASTMMALPTILIFLFAQRYFIQGVTFTGMKG